MICARPQLIGHGCHLMIITYLITTTKSAIEFYEYTLYQIMHHKAFYLPILFKHFSNNNADEITACSVLHLSCHCIFCKDFLTSRLLFQNSFDKLDNR